MTDGDAGGGRFDVRERASGLAALALVDALRDEHER